MAEGSKFNRLLAVGALTVVGGIFAIAMTTERPPPATPEEIEARRKAAEFREEQREKARDKRETAAAKKARWDRCQRYVDAMLDEDDVTWYHNECDEETGVLTLFDTIPNLDPSDFDGCREAFERAIGAFVAEGLNPRTDNQTIEFACRDWTHVRSVTGKEKTTYHAPELVLIYEPTKEAVRWCEGSYHFKDWDTGADRHMPLMKAKSIYDVAGRYRSKRFAYRGLTKGTHPDCDVPLITGGIIADYPRAAQ